MQPEHLFELVLALIAATVGLALLARRAHLPPAAALILGGIVLALIPGVPELALDPALSLVLFLPPLLMASAYATVWRDFRADLRIILQLAVGAVGFTTAVVGVVAHLVQPHLPWAACFALGAIVSPPDAVAAKAVLAGVRLPRRITVLLEGESLVNDATGLVLFRFAVLAVGTGGFSAGQAGLSFLVLAAGGVAAGLACGWLAMQVIRRLNDDPVLAIVATMLMAWGSYIGADALGVSGVLSTVACGLVVGSAQHGAIGARMRLEAGAVWETAVFVLESLVFILIGLSLRGVLMRLNTDWQGFSLLAPAMAAITLAVIVARFAWIVPATFVPRLLLPALRRADPIPPIGVPVVMSWCGMRGVVSLAAALSLPADFPGRDFILATTFAVILVTVLVQGTTLGPLIRLMRLEGLEFRASHTIPETEARLLVARAQYAAVERRSKQPDGTHLHPRLIEQYNFRIEASERLHRSGGSLAAKKSEHFAVVLDAIAAGRAELLRLHHDGRVHDTVLQALEGELDLEELAARRHQG